MKCREITFVPWVTDDDDADVPLSCLVAPKKRSLPLLVSLEFCCGMEEVVKICAEMTVPPSRPSNGRPVHGETREEEVNGAN